MKTLVSPTALYSALRARRDWLLAKIEYLQTESARWRTLFALIVSPYKLLRMAGIPPSACIGVLLALVGGGSYVAADVMLEGKSFARGDPGIYSAPNDIPVLYTEGDSTLRLDLSSVPVGEIIIEDISISIAPGSTIPTLSAADEVIYVGGLPSSTGFTGNYLEIGHLIIDRWRCKKLVFSEIEAHTLNLKWNRSDGQSVSAIPGIPINRAIGGGLRADSMQTSNAYYDHLVIQASTSNVWGRVDKMRLSNIYTSKGICVVKRLRVGTLDILFNTTGADSNLNTKDLVLKDTVVYKNFTNEGNTEELISPP
jgi:hypothetical protein